MSSSILDSESSPSTATATGPTLTTIGRLKTRLRWAAVSCVVAAVAANLGAALGQYYYKWVPKAAGSSFEVLHIAVLVGLYTGAAGAVMGALVGLLRGAATGKPGRGSAAIALAGGSGAAAGFVGGALAMACVAAFGNHLPYEAEVAFGWAVAGALAGWIGGGSASRRRNAERLS
jgi:hypothetical protein